MATIPLSNHYKPLHADEELLVSLRIAAQKGQPGGGDLQVVGEHPGDRFIRLPVGGRDCRTDVQVAVFNADDLVVPGARVHTD